MSQLRKPPIPNPGPGTSQNGSGSGPILGPTAGLGGPKKTGSATSPNGAPTTNPPTQPGAAQNRMNGANPKGLNSSGGQLTRAASTPLAPSGTQRIIANAPSQSVSAANVKSAAPAPIGMTRSLPQQPLAAPTKQPPAPSGPPKMASSPPPTSQVPKQPAPINNNAAPQKQPPPPAGQFKTSSQTPVASPHTSVSPGVLPKQPVSTPPQQAAPKQPPPTPTSAPTTVAPSKQPPPEPSPLKSSPSTTSLPPVAAAPKKAPPSAQNGLPPPMSASSPNILKGLPMDRVGPKKAPGVPQVSMPKVGFFMPGESAEALSPRGGPGTTDTSKMTSPTTSPRGPPPAVPKIGALPQANSNPSLISPTTSPRQAPPAIPSAASEPPRRFSRNVEAIVSPRRMAPGSTSSTSTRPESAGVDALVDPVSSPPADDSASPLYPDAVVPSNSRRQARFARQLGAGELWSIRNQNSTSSNQPAAEQPAEQSNASVPATLTRSTSAGVVPSRGAIISPPRRGAVESAKPGTLAAPRGRDRLESNAFAVRPNAEYKSVLQAAIPLQAGSKPTEQVQIEEDKEDNADDIDALGPDFWAVEKIEAELTEHRDRVANEIMTSEQSFNLFLRICIFLWERPMLQRAQKGEFGAQVKRETVAKLFGGIEGVYGASTIIMQELQKRLKQWSPTQLIGDVFVKFGDLLKLFAIYTKDHEVSIELLQQLTANPAVSAFFSEKRVPRYEMLLRDLLKATPTTHPDYANISAGLEKIKSIALIVDQSVEQRKKQEKLLSIEKSIVNTSGEPLLSPGRDFIREGNLVKLCRKDKKKRMFFLFTDILIYCTPMLIPGKFALAASFPIATMTISEVTDAELGSRTFDGPVSFKIQTPTKSFIVLAETPLLKADWVYDITNAISKAKEKGTRRPAEPVSFAPVLQQEGDASKCNGCGKSFSLILRKKHCRQCGAVVCNDCLTTKPGPSDSGERIKVCQRHVFLIWLVFSVVF